jgi:hypothetical protein
MTLDPPLREGGPTCTSHGTWIDLAIRESDGIEVTLLWSRASSCVKVAVTDTELDAGFDLDVPDADALSAFYHPFAYADRCPTCRPAVRMNSNLQLQG